MQRNPSSQLAGAGRSSHRQSGEYRGRNPLGANGDTGAGVAQGPAPFPNGQPRPNGMMGNSHSQQFDLARSPPNTTNKNTKHVPCKFFKQGACQAGQACPFLHSTDATIEAAPCKYFAKGNCKFGAKCALAHILPDGRRVNRPNGSTGMNINSAALNIGGRVNPPPYHHQDSALANSILSQQQFAADPHVGQYKHPQDELQYGQDYESRFANVATESGLNSNPGSKYGSPTNELPFPMSGVERRLTALDAPLPASFDSNGISHIARYGAVAASVPSKFGMESPPASLSQRAVGQPPDAVKALRSSVFPSNLRNSSQLESSPPTVNTEETSIQRKMHSEQNAHRPRLLSASVPRHGTSEDWDDRFPLEEDYLPTNLHDDVLTPQEKMRRLSRPEQDFGGSSNRPTPGGLGIPSGNSSKVSSPLGSSPSRFSALFAKQRQESSSNTATVTGFGHVGSPLRESHLSDTSPFGDGITAVRPSSSSRSRTSGHIAGDQSPFFSSPPRDSRDSGSINFGMNMNMISSQLHRTHLNTRNDTGDYSASNTSRLQPPTTRHVSAPAIYGGGRPGDRIISSPRITSTRIAEEREGEGDPLVFSMDPDDPSKRNSSLWGSSKSPVIAPLGEAGNGVGGSGGAGLGVGIGSGVEDKAGSNKTFSNGAGLENIYTGRS